MAYYVNLPSPRNQPTELTNEQLAIVLAIEAYDLWFVAERLADKQSLTLEQINIAIKEFKKFMALMALGHRNISMVSPAVDEVWHNFILFTYEYATFCNELIGGFVHHVPRTSRQQISSVGRERFVVAYERVFGTIPQIWTGGHALGERRRSNAHVDSSPDASVIDCDSGCRSIIDLGTSMHRADCEGVGDETALPPESLCSDGSKAENSPPREKEIKQEPGPTGQQNQAGTLLLS